MAVDQIVTIKYVADTKDIESSLKKIKTNSSDTSSNLKSVGTSANASADGVGKLGASIGVSASLMSGLINVAQQCAQVMLSFAKDSVMAASDFDENMNKTLAVFGEAGQDFIDQSGKMASAMGMSKNKYLESVSLFGAIAKAMDVPSDKMVEMSDKLTGLAADLGSFYNKDVEQAMTALKGALTGETEALKEFGIVANDTTMDKFAQSQGKAWSSLSAGEKAMMRYQYIMEQTTFIQGDFARTSDGLANSFKTLGSNVENLMIDIGGKLLQPVQSLIGDINLIFKAVSTSQSDLQTQFNESKGRIEELNAKANELKAAGLENTDEWNKLKDAIDAEQQLQNNINKTAEFQSQFEKFKPIIKGMIDNFKQNLSLILTPFKILGRVFVGLFKSIKPMIEPIFTTIQGINDKIQELIDKIFGNKENFNAFLSGVKTTLETIGYIIGSVIGGTIFVIFKIIEGIIWLIGQIVDGVIWLKDKVIEGAQMIKQAWDESIGSWIGWLWGKLLGLWDWFSNFPENVKTWWGNMCDWLTNKWNEFLDWVRSIDIIDAFFGAMKSIGTWLDNNVLQPIKDWFASLPSKIGSAIKSVGSAVVDGVKGALGLKSGLDLNVYHSALGGNSLGQLPQRQYTVYNYNMYTNYKPSMSFIENQRAIIEGGQGANFNNGISRIYH